MAVTEDEPEEVCPVVDFNAERVLRAMRYGVEPKVEGWEHHE